MDAKAEPDLFLRDTAQVGEMIRAASLRGFVTLVEELGGRAGELLDRHGIDQSMLGDDDCLVPITAHDQMLDAAALQLNCPDLGLRLAATQDVTVLGPLAVAIEASSTVGEALECAARFLFVHSPALSVTVEDDPLGRRGVVALTYRKDLRESPYSPQGMELGIGLFHRVAVALVGEVRGFRSVLFPHQPLSAVQRYVEHFGVDVRFGAPAAALCVQRQLLEQRFSGANPAVRVQAVEHLARRFTDPRLNLAVQVRLAIAEDLRTSAPTIASVARCFGVHPRTLQRRLSAEGTSFVTLLDEVRREAAVRYLTTTDLPLGQVAMLVGFSEQSTLSHAIRRWCGSSPSGLRRAASHGAEVQGGARSGQDP